MCERYSGLLSLLLIILFGCTKEGGTLPSSITDTNTGGYQLNGQAVSCQASATSGYILSSTDSLESLAIHLAAPPALATPASPYLILDFQRSATRPNTPYHLELATYFDGNYTKSIVFPDNIVAIIHETSRGVVSGTFATNKPGRYRFREGLFTNVHVQPPTD